MKPVKTYPSEVYLNGKWMSPQEATVSVFDHSTAFFVRDQSIYTHPEGWQILSGITRKVVLEICRDLGIAYKEEAFPLERISEVDEVFLTGTTTQITAVSSLHDKEKELFRGRKREDYGQASGGVYSLNACFSMIN